MKTLIDKDALGTIKEAEIHYDIDSPPWMSRMTSKKYSPGQGMAFGLGKCRVSFLSLSHQSPISNPPWAWNILCTRTPGLDLILRWGLNTGSHTLDQALILFGRPQSVTGFFRALRGIESEVDDTFTIILQYGAPRHDLLVTVKTNIVSPMPDQLKYFVRGTNGTFVKVRELSGE